MIRYTTYNPILRSRSSSEDNTLEELINQFKLLPDASGSTLLLEKEDRKLKFQVTYDDYYRITFSKKDEKRSILEKEEYSEKIIKIFAEENQEEFEKLYNNPLGYFHQKKADRQENKDGLAKPIEVKQNTAYKTHEGKSYTKEQWEKYEQEQWELYKQRKSKL